MSEISVHHTHTQKIQDPAKEGWEFRCPHCGYRAQYITKNGHGPRRLEIMDEGDPNARHTSAFQEDSLDIDWIRDEAFDTNADTAGYEEDDILLPVHLQLQIEEILKRADVDSWMT